MFFKKIIKVALIISIATTLHSQPITQQLIQQQLGLKSRIEFSDKYLQQIQDNYLSAYGISRNLIKALKTNKFTLKDLNELSEHPLLIKTVRKIRLMNIGRIILPTWIIKLSHLQKLDLSWKPYIDFSTTLFPPALETLNLNYCNLKQLPPSISSLTRLKKLNLSGNQNIDLTDAILPPTLEELSLRCCGLREVPSCIKTLPRLKILDLSGNQDINLASAIFPRSLKKLDLYFCAISAIPLHLDGLTISY